MRSFLWDKPQPVGSVRRSLVSNACLVPLKTLTWYGSSFLSWNYTAWHYKTTGGCVFPYTIRLPLNVSYPISTYAWLCYRRNRYNCNMTQDSFQRNWSRIICCANRNSKNVSLEFHSTTHLLATIYKNHIQSSHVVISDCSVRRYYLGK